ncbi:TlpA disulfide reductase family protein [Pedobacter sp. R20-19]|uniref:TlpA disulfide reductase family protein n=1 Tax=Pedobacter sp. R20-19 TaxID=1270196 RepID=UPI00068D1399|nr:TlpA disulfide reductase family protein [Pedobacter sp. R20-19]
MNKFKLLGTVILILGFMADLHAQSTVHVAANISGLKNGKVIFAYELDDVFSRDSVLANSDIFSKDIMLVESVRCTLTNSVNNQMRIFLMEKGSSVTITGDISKFFDLKIAGSKENEVLDKLKASLYAIPGKRPKATGKDEEDKEARRKFANKQQTLRDSVFHTFVSANPAQVATAIAIFDQYITYPNRAKASENYHLLSEEIKNTSYGKRIKTFIDANFNTSISSNAIEFSLEDADGKWFSLKDFKRKYILLDFWASWCGPCRLENPNLIKAYNRYHSKGFTIIGLSMDSSKENWLKAVEDDGLIWKQLNDPKSVNGKTADRYGVKSLPANFLIDADGKIIARNLRGTALEEKLEELLK